MRMHELEHERQRFIKRSWAPIGEYIYRYALMIGGLADLIEGRRRGAYEPVSYEEVEKLANRTNPDDLKCALRKAIGAEADELAPAVAAAAGFRNCIVHARYADEPNLRKDQPLCEMYWVGKPKAAAKEIEFTASEMRRRIKAIEAINDQIWELENFEGRHDSNELAHQAISLAGANALNGRTMAVRVRPSSRTNGRAPGGSAYRSKYVIRGSGTPHVSDSVEPVSPHTEVVSLAHGYMTTPDGTRISVHDVSPQMAALAIANGVSGGRVLSD